MGCGFSGLPAPAPWSLSTIGGASAAPCLECGAPGSVAATLTVGAASGALCARCAKISGRGDTVALLDGKLAHATLDFALIARDVWAITAMHAPANMHLPGLFLPNRMFAIRVRPAEGPPFIATYNTVHPDAAAEVFAALRRLAERTGAPVRYIFTTCALHNMFMPAWAAAFPSATALVPAGRCSLMLPCAAAPNLVAFDEAHPAVAALAAGGVELYIWRGLAERTKAVGGNDDLAWQPNAPRGAPHRAENLGYQSTLLFVKGASLVINGSHNFWAGVSDPRAAPFFNRGVGCMWRMMLKYPVHKDRTVAVRPGSIYPTFACFPAYDIDSAMDGFRRIVGPGAWPFEYFTDAHGLPGLFETRAAIVAGINEAYGPLLAPAPGAARPAVAIVSAIKAPPAARA